MYTASGAVLAFAAVLATFQDRFSTAFVLLIASTLVDATDGMLARAARVKELTPGFDGARLDVIQTDHFTAGYILGNYAEKADVVDLSSRRAQVA